MLVQASPAPFWLKAPLERMRIPVLPVKAVIGTAMFTDAVVPPAMFVPTCVHSDAS